MAVSYEFLGDERIIGQRMRIGEDLLEPPSDFDKSVRKAQLFDIFSDVQFLDVLQSRTRGIKKRERTRSCMAITPRGAVGPKSEGITRPTPTFFAACNSGF